MKRVLLGSVAALAMISGAYAQEDGMSGQTNGAYNSTPNGANHQWPRVVGHLAFEGGLNYVDDVYEEEDGTVFYWRPEGNVLYYVPNSNYAVGLAGFYQHEGYDSADDLDETYSPEVTWEIAGKAYKILSPRSRVGIWASYGQAKFNDQDYDGSHVALGVEGQHRLSDDFVIFGQAGLGDSSIYDDDNGYGYGFNRGYVVRGAVSWFACANSVITLDVETGGAGTYLSTDSSGRFFQTSLFGEYKLPVAAPVSVGAGIQHTSWNAVDYDESMTETRGMLKLFWRFGAQTPQDAVLSGDYYGTPDIPSGANRTGIWIYNN